MNIELLFVAFNRLGYTRLAIEALLADPKEDFVLTIWDNGSTDGTREFLRSLNDPRIVRKVMSHENVFLIGAANDCFGRSSADLLGIVADDFRVTPGWTRSLALAHREVPELGLISCWYLGEEVFDERRAQAKIQSFGRHRILRHPYTGGGAALVKRKSWKECGPFDGDATVNCWLRIAEKGYVNGFYVPPIFAEHMDYPWSIYYIPSESGEVGAIRRQFGINTVAEWKVHHARTVCQILEGPWEVKHYVGWRKKVTHYYRKYRKLMDKLK